MNYARFMAMIEKDKQKSYFTWLNLARVVWGILVPIGLIVKDITFNLKQG